VTPETVVALQIELLAVEARRLGTNHEHFSQYASDVIDGSRGGGRQERGERSRSTADCVRRHTDENACRGRPLATTFVCAQRERGGSAWEACGRLMGLCGRGR